MKRNKEKINKKERKKEIERFQMKWDKRWAFYGQKTELVCYGGLMYDSFSDIKWVILLEKDK